MGTSPNNLRAGMSYLRKQRIYEASLEFSPGSVRKPWYPDLPAHVWQDIHGHFETELEATSRKLQLPPVFTKRQSYVAGAICYLFETQGEQASTTYADLEQIIKLIKVDEDSAPTNISRHTIATVLYKFHNTGAIKYIPGFPGVKSQLTLNDLRSLRLAPSLGTQECTFSRTRQQYAITHPLPAPKVPTPARPLPPPSLGTQECTFSHEALLDDLYRGLRGNARGWVTRIFNQELVAQGLAPRIDYEVHPKLTYMLRTWRVSCMTEDDWKVQVALNNTKQRLQTLAPSTQTTIKPYRIDPTAAKPHQPAESPEPIRIIDKGGFPMTAAEGVAEMQRRQKIYADASLSLLDTIKRH